MSIQELLINLEEQDIQHRQLVELAEQKRLMLIQNDVEQLNGIVNRESKIVRHISTLEQQRVEILGQYLIKRGFRPDPRITISDLVKILFKAEEKEALMEAQQTLIRTMSELKEKNKLNQLLIQQSLTFVNYSLDLMTGGPEDDALYRHPGQQGTGYNRPGLYDARV